MEHLAIRCYEYFKSTNTWKEIGWVQKTNKQKNYYRVNDFLRKLLNHKSLVASILFWERTIKCLPCPYMLCWSSYPVQWRIPIPLLGLIAIQWSNSHSFLYLKKNTTPQLHQTSLPQNCSQFIPNCRLFYIWFLYHLLTTSS